MITSSSSIIVTSLGTKATLLLGAIMVLERTSPRLEWLREDHN